MSSSTPKGSDSITAWTRRGEDSAGSWRSEKDTGAAFRGMTRGRGRGGGAARGRQGGGRGAGSRSVSARGALDVPKSTPPPLPIDKTGSGGNSVAKNSALPLKAREIPKVSSRPNLTVDAQAAQSSDPTSPLSPSKPTRRRRNTHKRSASAAIPKPIPTALMEALPTSPSAPLVPASKESKDPSPNAEKATNPHAHVHDLRKEITNLVQHVRNMAMDVHRPNSPTTHIDWAGDDDDSLPDLDDWGISSKLASDVGETSAKVASKPDPVTQTLPDASSTSVPEKLEPKDGSVGQIVMVDGAQSSAESPTESSMSMSLSVPPPVKRTRERRRGGRRDKEKRASLASQVNGTGDKQVQLTTTPKKSLLERISSPIRPEPPLLLQEIKPAVAPSSSDQVITSAKSEPNVSRNGALPPKPLNLPKKPPPSSKTSGSWRASKGERLLPKDLNPPVKSVPIATAAQDSPEPTEKVATAVPTVEPPAKEEVNVDSSNLLEETPIGTSSVVPREHTVPATNTSSFDWSEEPISLNNANQLDDDWPPVEVVPATPSNNVIREAPPASTPTIPLTADNTERKSSASPSPRFRSQRPLSGDSTPRPRRERSPYKTHMPRNHSMPHAGSMGGSRSRPSPSPSPSPFGRPRPQHVSRPVIRMDALAMISRSLRESPPPRRESPPATKVGES
ncbi:hypothetical protein ACEPAH_5649 [Sanghuangporus vaninii]